MSLLFRKSKNAKNVVSFLGSVLTCRSPLTLDLLFEDNGDQSLADLIFGTNWELPSQFDGFMKAKDTAMQIVDGLEFLHENAIVHGHLSPDTILVCSLASYNRLYKLYWLCAGYQANLWCSQVDST